MARGRKSNPVPQDEPVVIPVAKPPQPVAHNEGSLGGTGDGVTMPGGMTQAAQDVWRRVVPLIASMYPLRESDADALHQYCDAVCLRAKAMAELQKPNSELILCTPNGAYQTNPLFKIIAQFEAVMMKIGERFGLDPTSRRRLKIADKQANADPFQEFISGGGRRKPNTTTEKSGG